MSKGLVDQLLGLYHNILEDVVAYHPNDRGNCDRDYSRLMSLSEEWGVALFTLHLPAVDKVLTSALESGVLPKTGEPLTRTVNRRTRVPRLFQGLWSRLFAFNGCLRQDIDPHDLFLLRSLLNGGKKLELECSDTVLYTTVKEYYDVDQSLPPVSKIWSGEDYDPSVVRGWSLLDHPTCDGFFGNGGNLESRELLALTQRIGDRVAAMLGEYLPSQHQFKHGPGAVSDGRTGMVYKYAFPGWPSRLSQVFPADEFASANLNAVLDPHSASNPWDLSDEEPASKMCAVPKTQKAPRLIAAEPTAHQWCQQSVSSFLADSIRRSPLGNSIDFKRQDLSGQLALDSSLTKEFATVDLSSASDRLSCWLVERLFRANYSVLRALTASRTRYLTNDLDVKSPKLYELRKFASMGSALTFPVQSLVFLILCLSAGLATETTGMNGLATLTRRVRVYGDDLIVPVSWMPKLREILALCHLRINDAKTFEKGNFRESCGVDAFKGVDVTPIRVRRFFDESAPSTLQSAVDVSNNFYYKGLWNAANFMLSPVPAWMRELVPWVRHGSGSFGLYTASGFSSTSRERWNSNWHVQEYETLSFVAKADRTHRHEGFANLLQFFTEDPADQELSSWSSGYVAKATTRMRRGWATKP